MEESSLVREGVKAQIIEGLHRGFYPSSKMMHTGELGGYVRRDAMKDDLSPETLEEINKLAATSIHDNPDPDGALHRLAEAALSISYEEDGRWRINYRMPRGAVIGLSSKYPAELAMAQMRGIMADFCGRNK